MRGVVLPHGLVSVLGQAPAGLVGLVALELLHRFDGAGEGLPDFVEHVAETGLGVGIFGELARGGRVRDVAFAGFLEDAVVGYGKADDAAEVRFRQTAFCCEVGEGDFPVYGYMGGDVIFVDCLEAYTIQLRSTFSENSIIGNIGVLTTGRRHIAGPRRSWWSSRLESRAFSRACRILSSSI